MFDIHLTADAVPDSDDYALYGKIQIEDYIETFVASLVCWSPAQYEQHWREACQRIVDGSHESVLISSYVDASMSEFLVWWPLYPEGQIVHVRNEILPYSALSKPFDVKDPWVSIRPRRIVTDEGLKISEWDTSIQSIEAFLARNKSTGF